MIKKGWSDAATNNKLDINISGLDPIPQFYLIIKTTKSLKLFLFKS